MKIFLRLKKMKDYEQGLDIFKNFLLRSNKKYPDDPYLATLRPANPTDGLNRHVKTAITKCKKLTRGTPEYQKAYNTVLDLLSRYNPKAVTCVAEIFQNYNRGVKPPQTI